MLFVCVLTIKSIRLPQGCVFCQSVCWLIADSKLTVGKHSSGVLSFMHCCLQKYAFLNNLTSFSAQFLHFKRIKCLFVTKQKPYIASTPTKSHPLFFCLPHSVSTPYVRLRPCFRHTMAMSFVFCQNQLVIRKICLYLHRTKERKGKPS